MSSLFKDLRASDLPGGASAAAPSAGAGCAPHAAPSLECVESVGPDSVPAKLSPLPSTCPTAPVTPRSASASPERKRQLAVSTAASSHGEKEAKPPSPSFLQGPTFDSDVAVRNPKNNKLVHALLTEVRRRLVVKTVPLRIFPYGVAARAIADLESYVGSGDEAQKLPGIGKRVGHFIDCVLDPTIVYVPVPPVTKRDARPRTWVEVVAAAPATGGGGRMGGGHGHRVLRAVEASVRPVEVFVPKELAGLVIGRRGCNIDYIRRSTGATIDQLADNYNGITTVVFLIKGSDISQVEAARTAMTALIASKTKKHAHQPLPLPLPTTDSKGNVKVRIAIPGSLTK